MTTNMTEVLLRDCKELTSWDRFVCAPQLVQAGRKRGLEHLPFGGTDYTDSRRAAAHLRRESKRRFQGGSYVIELERRGIGQAAVEVARPLPDLPSDYAGQTAVQLAFWHAAQSGPESSEIDREIVSQLIDIGREHLYGDGVLWMVAPPDDDPGARIISASGFQPEGTPRTYQLRGDILAPQQLWIKPHLSLKAAVA